MNPLTAWIKANKLYATGLGVVLAIGFVSACYIAVTKAYDSVYQSGYRTGKNEVELANQREINRIQAANASLQHQIDLKNGEFALLSKKLTQMEATGPQEVIKYVRSDPKFAASRRPPAAQSLRVRELQALREIAATH